MHSNRTLLLLALFALAGCRTVAQTTDSGSEGGDVATTEAATDAPASDTDAASGTPCTTTADCASGEVCYGPAGCGAQWTCVAAFACSNVAAQYCDCNGNTFTASIGCPERPYAQAGACVGDGGDAAEIGDAGDAGPPPGTFACGSTYCAIGTTYCQSVYVSFMVTQDTCQPMPTGCGATPACSCLASVMCGTNCVADANGNLTVYCPGGA